MDLLVNHFKEETYIEKSVSQEFIDKMDKLILLMDNYENASTIMPNQDNEVTGEQIWNMLHRDE